MNVCSIYSSDQKYLSSCLMISESTYICYHQRNRIYVETEIPTYTAHTQSARLNPALYTANFRRPRESKSTVWKLNDENVVNDPQNPTPKIR